MWPELFPVRQFSRYRRLAEATNQCGPFVPFVGERYGDGTLPKFVYCGAAAWWNDYNNPDGEDEAALELSRQSSVTFVQGGMLSSPFWWLFDEILESLDKEKRLSKEDRRQTAAWTNVSKLGSLKRTAPDDTADLRKLDSEQLKHEISILKPDIFLCVSGSSLIRTGEDVFHKFESANTKAVLPQSEVRRLPGGGSLYWTMHPGGRGKGRDWRNIVVGDVSTLSASGAA